MTDIDDDDVEGLFATGGAADNPPAAEVAAVAPVEPPEPPPTHRHDAHDHMRHALDSLEPEGAGAVARLALEYGIDRNDPTWPLLRGLLDAGSDVATAGERLLAGLDDHGGGLLRQIDERAGEIGLVGKRLAIDLAGKLEEASRQEQDKFLRAAHELGLAVEKGAAESASASSALSAAINALEANHDKRINDLFASSETHLKAAAQAEVAGLRKEWGKVTGDEFKRQMANYRRIGFVRSTLSMFGVLLLGGLIGFGIAVGIGLQMGYVSPMPIAHCDMTVAHPYCILRDTGLRLP